jgi:hypothetical protein
MVFPTQGTRAFGHAKINPHVAAERHFQHILSVNVWRFFNGSSESTVACQAIGGTSVAHDGDTTQAPRALLRPSGVYLLKFLSQLEISGSYCV